MTYSLGLGCLNWRPFLCLFCQYGRRMKPKTGCIPYSNWVVSRDLYPASNYRQLHKISEPCTLRQHCRERDSTHELIVGIEPLQTQVKKSRGQGIYLLGHLPHPDSFSLLVGLWVKGLLPFWWLSCPNKHQELGLLPTLFDKSHGFFILPMSIGSYGQHPDFDEAVEMYCSKSL